MLLRRMLYYFFRRQRNTSAVAACVHVSNTLLNEVVVSNELVIDVSISDSGCCP